MNNSEIAEQLLYDFQKLEKINYYQANQLTVLYMLLIEYYRDNLETIDLSVLSTHELYVLKVTLMMDTSFDGDDYRLDNIRSNFNEYSGVLEDAVRLELKKRRDRK